MRGGYPPEVIVAKRGQPLRLKFNRRETDTCSVIPDCGIRRDLPAFRSTGVEVVPNTAGEYTFTCGMNMLRGELIVRD